MYVITALHNTGHGEEATTLYIADSFEKTLDVARSVEKLGVSILWK
ncbi:MAG TPA: hypothetical protein VJH55_04235 [Candidatus Paceibacterota bacterium]